MNLSDEPQGPARPAPVDPALEREVQLLLDGRLGAEAAARSRVLADPAAAALLHDLERLRATMRSEAPPRAPAELLGSIREALGRARVEAAAGASLERALRPFLLAASVLLACGLALLAIAPREGDAGSVRAGPRVSVEDALRGEDAAGAALHEDAALRRFLARHYLGRAEATETAGQ